MQALQEDRRLVTEVVQEDGRLVVEVLHEDGRLVVEVELGKRCACDFTGKSLMVSEKAVSGFTVESQQVVVIERATFIFTGKSLVIFFRLGRKTCFRFHN